MKKIFEKIFKRKADKNNNNLNALSYEQAEIVNEIYSADNPINNPDFDEFNRKEYSERIAQTIATRKDTKSLVIGIYGKWGEGKTTVLNFINSKLKKNDDFLTIFFNPWMFPSETELFVAFYTELAKGLEKPLSNTKEKIGEVIKDYLAPFAGLLDKGDSAEKIGSLLSGVSLEELRDRIGKFLVDQKKMVVVFMDDIDRLDKDEIHAIFRLIKLSANFENVVYVLAFDPEIVEDALSERYFSKKKIAGQNFLEKIVQVPIDLPKVPIADLRKFCYKQIDKALQINEIELSESEIQEFTRGFITGLEIRLETPRMAIRYGNMLNFSLPLVKGEVNIVDFLLIEAIRAFYPDAYKFIKDNRYAFTARILSEIEVPQTQREEIKIIVNKIYQGLTDEETANLRKLITLLFPRQENTTYTSSWDKTWQEEKRIASEKYFDRYFTYSIPRGDISDIFIDSFIQSLKTINGNDLNKFIKQEINLENSESFVSKLIQKLDKIDTDEKVKLALGLCVFGDLFQKPKNDPIPFATPFSRAALLISMLVEFLPNHQEKVTAVTEIINKANPLSFAFEIFNWIKNDQLAGKSAEDYEKLLGIENILATRIEVEAINDMEFFDKYQNDTPNLIWFWKKYGSQENASKYLAEFLNKDIQNVHKLLNSIVPMAYPLMGRDLPRISDFRKDQYEYLQHFAEPNLIYEALKSYYGDKLHSNTYPYNDNNSTDIRIAKQFFWIHSQTLKNRDFNQ